MSQRHRGDDASDVPRGGAHDARDDPPGSGAREASTTGADPLADADPAAPPVAFAPATRETEPTPTRASAAVGGRPTPAASLASTLGWLAARWPAPVAASDDLSRSLAYLRAAVDGETVVAAGYALAIPVAVVALGAFALAGAPVFVAGLLALGAGLGATHAVHRGPVLLAAVRRTRALGGASELVTRVALRLRLDPSPEAAAAFAARLGDDPLAASLAGHARRAAGTPRAGFDGFADEWRPWFPAIDRSVALLLASAEASPGERDRSLDRAVSVTLRATRDAVAAFAGEVRGPATALYAFGVFLPLALVGAIPAAATAGIGVSTTSIVLVYDLLLPAAVAVGAGAILLRRPVAFPPPTLDRTHPAVPDRRWPGPVAGLAAAAVAWLVAARIVPWAAPLAAVGLGAGTALVVHFRPVVAVHRRVRAVESGLADALYLVGRRVAGGESVERAVADAGEDLTGETATVFADAAAVGRRLRVGVRESFLGEHGALADLPSPRVRSAGALLALAGREGRPAGRAIVDTAEQLAELRELEREARRELTGITRTLANTGTVFAPLVAGATVALAAGMPGLGGVASAATGATAATAGASSAAGATGGGSGALGAGSSAGVAGASSMGSVPPIPELGVAVGGYVLLTAALLALLSTTLARGLDRTLVGYRVGGALVLATPTYLLAVVVGSSLF